MTIERKTIRDFMQKEMRERLFSNNTILRNALCEAYADFIDRYVEDLTLDEKIEFINALQEYCEDFADFHGYGTYKADFFVDPANTQDWERFMDSIYKEV